MEVSSFHENSTFMPVAAVILVISLTKILVGKKLGEVLIRTQPTALLKNVSLTHSCQCQELLLTVFWIYDTLDNNLEIKNDFIKDFKKSCC